MLLFGARQFAQLGVVLLMVCVAMLLGFGIAWLLIGDSRDLAAYTTAVVTPQPSSVSLTPSPHRLRAVLSSSDERSPQPDARSTTTLAPTPSPDIRLMLDVTPTPPPVVVARIIEDRFNAPSGDWIVQSTAAWSAQYDAGRYRLTLNNQLSINVAAPIDADSFRVAADVVVMEGGAGIVFGAAKPASFYRIMISAEGEYALQLQQGEHVRDVIPWTPSDALSTVRGTGVRLEVERVGRVVRFRANAQSLTEWSVPATDLINHYGLAAVARERRADAIFDNLVGERLASP